MSNVTSKVVVASQELNDAIVELRALRRQMKVLEAKEKELKDKICLFMGDAQDLIDSDGLIAVSWVETKEFMRLDVDTLKLMYPDAYNDCLVKNPGVRRFLVK